MTYCISNLEGLIGRCKPPFDWMNVQTTNNVTMAIANLVSKWLRASTEETIYLNLPFRLISSIGSYKRGEHYKVALDVASLRTTLLSQPLVGVHSYRPFLRIR